VRTSKTIVTAAISLGDLPFLDEKSNNSLITLIPLERWNHIMNCTLSIRRLGKEELLAQGM
jgi:hypothetical protein